MDAWSRAIFVSTLSLAGCAGILPDRSKPARPNILFIMPDQWRGMDVGAAGNREVRTPNLDRLAREGVLFQNAVANAPVCTPARGMLLTGKYPYTTGTAANDVPLPPAEITIAEILAGQGYRTGFVGKWHLEGGAREPGFVPPGPRRQGFDFWAANICRHNYFNQVYFRDEPNPIRMSGYDAVTWTDLAIEFLGQAREPRQPFLLYLQYPTPHDPYLVPPGLEGMYDENAVTLRGNWRPGAPRLGSRADLARYYAAITGVDREIGRILARLGELGLADDTIVFVTSDHGDMLGSHGAMLKRKPWEESIRVPGVLRWPAGLAAGRIVRAPFSHVDVVPTLLGLAGVAPPRGMHGFDHSDSLRGRQVAVPELAHLMIHTKSEEKLPPWRGVRSAKYKYARFEDRPWLLHDLEVDPLELHNLVDDPAHRALIARFDAAIQRRMVDTADSWQEQHDAPYR